MSLLEGKIKKQDIKKLYNLKQSAEFYEESYKKGYMDEWPSKKKQRLIEIIEGLQLPEKGDALDFGCRFPLEMVNIRSTPNWLGISKGFKG